MLRAFAGKLFLAGAAWATEPAHEGGGDVSLFAGDLGNAVWTVVIFLLVVFVLGRYAWGPLLSALQRREEFIRDSLQRAKSDREAAEARLAEYEARLVGARQEASAIVEEGRRDGEVVKARLEGEARAEADRLIERAKREIDLARASAVRDLYERSASMATAIAERILRREVRPADHERLIAETIDELGGREIQ
jgi:F-type H+-transporting ATPase subunit b